MSLNTETLNTILAPYIRSLTDGETAENGVWEAINCFGTNWDTPKKKTSWKKS